MIKQSVKKIKPLKSYRKPSYPGKEHFAANPGRLLSYVPGAWVNKPLALSALLAFICSGNIPAPAKEPLPFSASEDGNRVIKENTIAAANTGAEEQKPAPREQSTTVAPLFIHGTGAGTTGCVVMSPPVFLSEAEAIEIILSELKNAGFRFDTVDYIVPGIFTREVSEEYDPDWKSRLIEQDARHPFYFDLYDKQYNVGIKFISRNNYFKLGGPSDSSTAQGYDFIDIAQKTREILMGQNKTNAAVFYDPLPTGKAFSLEAIDEGKDIGRRELKEQVRDFIYWLEREAAAKIAGTGKNKE